jgi:tetratricopeptide (TPR) repeat protein
MAAGRFEEAAAVFLHVLKYDPDNPDILNNLALVRLDQGRLDAALPLLQQANRANPNHHQTYSNLALYFRTTNDGRRAIEQMTKAIELAPMDATYRFAIASLLVEEKRFEEARTHFLEATQRDPNHVQGFVKLTEVCLELGLGEEAVNALERASALAPNDPVVAALMKRLATSGP